MIYEDDMPWVAGGDDSKAVHTSSSSTSQTRSRSFQSPTGEYHLMDNPWNDGENDNVREAEWSKISNDFTNAGYREGIVAGKESALQEGFDTGFAIVGVPLGYGLGHLRGVISAIVSFIASEQAKQTSPELLIEARELASALSSIRFSDIAPPDLEAEQHAREHLVGDDLPVGRSEDSEKKSNIETLEENLGAGPKGRPTTIDVGRLKTMLEDLQLKLGL